MVYTPRMTRLSFALLLGCAVAACAQQTPHGKIQPPAVIQEGKPDVRGCHAVNSEHPKTAVIVLLKVKEDGTSDLVGIADTSGNACVDEAAIAAVKQYRFRPAMRDGQPVAVNLKIEVRVERLATN